jgi:hypothetical protein
MNVFSHMLVHPYGENPRGTRVLFMYANMTFGYFE